MAVVSILSIIPLHSTTLVTERRKEFGMDSIFNSFRSLCYDGATQDKRGARAYCVGNVVVCKQTALVHKATIRTGKACITDP